MPTISVIIPVYKVEAYLRDCVDSVLAQTFTDFELILVDDGSPDACGAICDEYAARDGRIHVIHQENAGQGKARNVGMDRAVGKYLIFLDSDDYWLPSTLETLYAEAEKNQTQVLVFGAKPFGDGIERWEKYPSYQQTVQNGVIKSGPESLKISMENHEYYSVAWNKFYLLSYLRSYGLCFDEGIIREDVRISFLSHLFAERVECIGARFYQYRKRPDSTMTGSSIQNTAHGCRVALDGLLDAYENRPLSALGREQLARYIAVRGEMFCDLFRQTLGQDRKAAAWIQRDVRKTMKRLRAIPGLSRSLRLATYDLYLSHVVTSAYRRLRSLSGGKT